MCLCDILGDTWLAVDGLPWLRLRGGLPQGFVQRGERVDSAVLLDLRHAAKSIQGWQLLIKQLSCGPFSHTHGQRTHFQLHFSPERTLDLGSEHGLTRCRLQLAAGLFRSEYFHLLKPTGNSTNIFPVVIDALKNQQGEIQDILKHMEEYTQGNQLGLFVGTPQNGLSLGVPF